MYFFFTMLLINTMNASGIVGDFNRFVRNNLRFLDDPVVSQVLMLCLILYGSLAAPQLPPKVAVIFTNTYFRIAVMTFILWTANRNPTLALLAAVVFFMSLHYATKNALTQVARTGQVSPNVAVIISGGNGPSIKPDAVKSFEASLMQSSVQEGKFKVVPEATLSSTGAPKAEGSALSVIPSGVAANQPVMTAAATSGSPKPFVSDPQNQLAPVPYNEDVPLSNELRGIESERFPMLSPPFQS